ncbi:MAG TPA: family 78 glycoside hydrolase catalytic domain [Mycobacteriales bacterium]|nr:family 78 glycoside hydrolase catalytic domain [Mycobacteriales bacterium]
MGLLEPADWTAKWIGAPESAVTPGVSLETARQTDALGRIWVDGVTPIGGTGRFRGRFEVPRGARILGAAVTVSGAGEIAVRVNGRPVPAAGDVSSAVRSGPNVISVAVEAPDGEPAGIVGRLEVWLEGLRPVRLDTSDPWYAVTSAPEGWGSPEFDDSGWPRAEIVAAHGEPPRGREPVSYRPSPYLRRDFTVDGEVRRARIFSTALGIYELRLNGERVGDDYLAPGWTDYSIRIPYQVYDVTGALKSGANAIGAILGDGWYAGNICWFGQFQYGDRLALRAQLEIEYTDGRRDVIDSDSAWQAGEGGIRYADLQNGTIDDARLEPMGWSEPGFTGFGPAAAVLDPQHGALVAAAAPPVRVAEELPPRSVTRRPDGRILVDFGQNLVGWARLRLRGNAGDRILLRHAEALQADGELYTIALRSATATDEYIFRGDPEGEVFEPRFTVHGFRYLEISGYDGDLDIVARVAFADMEQIGEFHCSNPALDKLQQNIVWGQRGNFLSVPTDCPQRDERLGWTGDAQVFAATAAFNYDVRGFFKKWITDLVDAQRPSGAVTHVAPDILSDGFRLRSATGDSPDWAGAAGWGDAIAIVPWELFGAYGDERLIGAAYAGVSRWISYLEKNSTGLIRPNEGFGDWLAIAPTATDLVSTAFFAYAADLAGRLAGILEFHDDAKRYAELYQQVRAAFRAKYVQGGARVAGGSQTAYVLALHFGLFEEREIDRAVQHLVAEVQSRNWHLTTGFLGTPYLLSVLSENGALDAAYRLLMQDTFPSWLYPVVHGDATTIWERWDSWSDSRGFQDPGMTSFNHYAYGAVGEWIYRNVGGIDRLEPGYRRIRIRPRPGGELTWATAALNCPYGRIESAWSLADGAVRLEVTVPPNTTAEVWVPTSDAAAVTEGGAPAPAARAEAGAAIFEVGSGTYAFTAPR